MPLTTPLPTTEQRHQEAARQTPSARSALRIARTRPSTFALLLTVALLVANAIAQHSFLTPGNWPALIGTLAPFVLVALASTPPILGGGGGIDISVGPLAALVNCLFVQVLVPHGVSSAGAAIPILLILGVAVGTVNGLLVVVVRLQPVIATLAMFFVLSGIALDVAPNPVTLPAGNWTLRLATSIGGVPGGLITMAAAAAIWLGLRRTAYVRTLYAVGSDDVAVFSAGVNVGLVRVGAYMLTGADRRDRRYRAHCRHPDLGTVAHHDVHAHRAGGGVARRHVLPRRARRAVRLLPRRLLDLPLAGTAVRDRRLYQLRPDGLRGAADRRRRYRRLAVTCPIGGTLMSDVGLAARNGTAVGDGHAGRLLGADWHDPVPRAAAAGRRGRGRLRMGRHRGQPASLPARPSAPTW